MGRTSMKWTQKRLLLHPAIVAAEARAYVGRDGLRRDMRRGREVIRPVGRGRKTNCPSAYAMERTGKGIKGTE